jgi:lipopolysaccharide export system protein LptA
MGRPGKLEIVLGAKPLNVWRTLLRWPGASAPRMLLPLFVCLGSVPVLAEKADRDKPINLEADKVTLDDINKVSLFEGNVVMTQGTLRIAADKVTVKQDKDGFQYATALGKQVAFKTKRDGLEEYVEGFADRVEFDGKTDKIELFNHAMLKRNLDELHGNYISYDSKTEFFLVNNGAAPGGSAGKPQDRVRAVLQPKTKAGAASPPSAPLKPETGIATPPR